MVRDRQTKSKSKKQTEIMNEVTEANEDIDLASASAGSEKEGNIDLRAILMEIKDFRKDNTQQLQEIKGEINATNARLVDVESRILDAEERVQSVEDIVTELFKIQSRLETQLTDQEGRSRRNNIRIYSIPEGEEKNATSMIDFIENLLKENLQLPTTLNLQIERAHRALAPAPPDGAPPRSIVARFLSYRTKEEVLRKAWQKKGFIWKGKQINLDNDYAPNVLRQRQSYAEAKKILKERGIRFQTPFPAKLRVFYSDGTRVYTTAEEATKDMSEKGLPVTVIKPPATMMEQLKSLTWSMSDGNRRKQHRDGVRTTRARPSTKERLEQFRREPV